MPLSPDVMPSLRTMNSVGVVNLAAARLRNGSIPKVGLHQ